MPQISLRILAMTACSMMLAAAADAATDLIHSDRGGSPQWDFCYGKSDATALPADPRTLVQPNISTGRAVAFNAYWKDCHTDPEAVEEIAGALGHIRP